MSAPSIEQLIGAIRRDAGQSPGRTSRDGALAHRP